MEAPSAQPSAWQLVVAADRRLIFLLGVMAEALAWEYRDDARRSGAVLAEAASVPLPENEPLAELVQDFTAYHYGERSEPTWLRIREEDRPTRATPRVARRRSE